MYDYEYDPSIPLLSIHGIQILKPTSERVFDVHEYLNVVMEIKNEERNEIKKVQDNLSKMSSELDKMNDELDKATEEIKAVVDEIIYLEKTKNTDTENNDEKTDPDNN